MLQVSFADVVMCGMRRLKDCCYLSFWRIGGWKTQPIVSNRNSTDRLQYIKNSFYAITTVNDMASLQKTRVFGSADGNFGIN